MASHSSKPVREIEHDPPACCYCGEDFVENALVYLDDDSDGYCCVECARKYDIMGAAISAANIPDPAVKCTGCDNALDVDGEAYFGEDEDYYCESCANDNEEQVNQSAEEYAAATCEITQPLPREEPFNCHTNTERGPDENSYMNYCRHQCTNYDELIRGLDRHSLDGRATYEAIRERVTNLIEDKLAEMKRMEEASSVESKE